MESEKIRLEHVRIDLYREKMRLNQEFRMRPLENTPISMVSVDVVGISSYLKELPRVCVGPRNIGQSCCRVLKSKAQATYAISSNTQCANYNTIKKTLF